VWNCSWATNIICVDIFSSKSPLPINKEGKGCSSVIQCSLSILKVLGSIPSTGKAGRQEGRKEGRKEGRQEDRKGVSFWFLMRNSITVGKAAQRCPSDVFPLFRETRRRDLSRGVQGKWASRFLKTRPLFTLWSSSPLSLLDCHCHS
jgi:hypothetical protein